MKISVEQFMLHVVAYFFMTYDMCCGIPTLQLIPSMAINIPLETSTQIEVKPVNT